jgi:hypothetical protein
MKTTVPSGTRRFKLAALVFAAVSTSQAGIIAWGPVAYSIGAPGGGGTPTGAAIASPINGNSGIKLSGTGQLSFDATDPSFVAGAPSGPKISWWNAEDSGPQGTFDSPTLPVTYDFTTTFSPAPGGQAEPVSWTLDLGVSTLLNSHIMEADTVFTGTTAAGGGIVTGSGSIAVPILGDFIGWNFALEADALSTDGATVSITVPLNSIDINPTPEPGSMGLVIAGAVLVAMGVGIRSHRAAIS